jgi:gp16 family phage-associated protein
MPKHSHPRGPKPQPKPEKKALAKVRIEMQAAGISVAEWSRANGFARTTVVDVLLGRRAGHRGEAHRVAVALGLKEGQVVQAWRRTIILSAQRQLS